MSIPVGWCVRDFGKPIQAWTVHYRRDIWDTLLSEVYVYISVCSYGFQTAESITCLYVEGGHWHRVICGFARGRLAIISQVTPLMAALMQIECKVHFAIIRGESHMTLTSEMCYSQWHRINSPNRTPSNVTQLSSIYTFFLIIISKSVDIIQLANSYIISFKYAYIVWLYHKTITKKLFLNE